MNATGLISKVLPGEGFYAFVPFPDTDILERRQVTNIDVLIGDGRTITPEQRRKVFALVSDITQFISAPTEPKRHAAEREVLREMQLLYLIDHTDTVAVRRQLTYHFCSLIGTDLFSLSDVDITTASEFIDWLVELCITYSIPCIDTLKNRCEDIGRYLYMCVANRICAECNKPADIHEVERVGMGNNRRRMHHVGQLVQPLCREHHSECHTIGQADFDEKYHLEAIRLDEKLCRLIKWKK